MLANRLTRCLLAGVTLGLWATMVPPGGAIEQPATGSTEARAASEAGPPVVTALVPTILPLVPGASGTVTVTINAAQASDTVVALATTDPTVVGLPPSGTVTVPAGQRSQPFAVFGISPGTCTVTATLPGSSVQSRVTVSNAPPVIVSLLPPILPLTEGSTGTLTVTLSAGQPTATEVSLATSDPGVVGLPGDRVTVPAGFLTGTIPVTGLARGTATVTASLRGTASTAAITVQPPPPTLTRLACPATVTAGATGRCTLTLNASQPTDTVVPLASSDPSAATVPASVTIPAGTVTSTITITASALGVSTLTAGPLQATTQTATVQVLPQPPTVASLLPSPATLGVGTTITLTLALNAAQVTETTVALASTPAGLLEAPATVTVPAGSLTAPVPLTALVAGQATVTAGPLHGSQTQTAVTVTPAPATVTGLTPSRLELPQGSAEPLTVTILPAQPGAVTVPLSSSDPTTVEVPPAVPVPAGETTAPFPVIGRAPGEATVTAGPLGGASRQATVTVRPPELRTLALAPPSLSLVSGQNQPFTATGTFTDGSTQDLTAVVTWATSAPVVAGVSAGGVATAFEEGVTIITATHPTGRTASASLAVSRGGPSVTGFRPQSGQVGETVALTGLNFIGASAVTFNGTPAAFTITNPTTLTALVPDGATTGPLAVTTAVGTGTSRGAFVVLPDDDVSLTAAPAQLTTLAGGEVHVALSASGRRGGSGLLRLGVSGLPAGAAALFAPPVLGPNQSGTLAIQVSPATPAGVYPLTLIGTAMDRARPAGRHQPLTLTILAGGQAALTGRIVDTHRRPIRGVSIQVPLGTTTLEAITDAAGNFLLQHVPAGEQLVLVDGYPASTAQAKYPTIPITVTIQPGVVNRLPFTPHLHAQKDRNFTPIHPTRETVATDADHPGVALRIPAGAKIIGWDGQPVSQVSITTVPLDRLPVPPPPAEARVRTVYMFYFGTRGGGTATRPIPFDAPNDLGLAPGAKARLWYFAESPLRGVGPNAWRTAGTGTVTADGRLIRSDPGVGIPTFCCGSSAYGHLREEAEQFPGPTCQPGQQCWKGDPVDVSTGIFMLQATDLVLPGRLPVTLTRAYRSGVALPGQFGVGTTLGYDEFLLAEPGGEVLTYLSLWDAKTPFTRQPDGSYINTTVPAFRGARITANPDGTKTFRAKDGRATVFDAAGVPIRLQDRTGNTLTLTRGVYTDIVGLTEPAGRALSLTVNTEIIRHRTEAVTDPLGRTVTYQYDASNRLVAVTDPAGGVTRYAYDSQHRMTSVTNPRGITYLQNSYDANSRVCQQQHADGATFQFHYITADRATLPESLQLLTEAAAGGPITQAVCGTATSSTSIVTATVLVDPRGNPTTYRFNGQSALIEVTDALGQVTTYEREAGTNLLLSVTDSLGRVTSYQYDANGNVTQITPPVTDPVTPPRTFTYEPTYSQVTSITDPLGNLTTFEYDTQGNLTAITDPEQNLKPEPERLKTRMTYNSVGQVLTTTDPLGNTSTVTYDEHGDLASIADPLGHTSQRTYDGVSRLATQTDPLGRTTQFSYDPLNRLTTILDPLNHSTQFTYDPNGNLLTVSDAWGNTTTHEYNTSDRLSRRIDPLGKAETFEYDGNGNLTSTTDRKHQTTTFTYDALNRRTRAEYADGAVATFTYDAGSRLTQADDTADPHRPITLTYDTLDRLLSETTVLGTVGYAYDTAGRRTSMTVSGQSPLAYTYDANSRLRTITQAPLTPVDIQYDAGGRRTLLTLPNGVSTEYQYDLASRLTALTYRNALEPLGDLQYGYDAGGNRVSIGGSFARSLLPETVPSATYDQGNRQLAFGASTMIFDDNGNLLTQTDPSGTITYTWDARNRLTALSGPSVSGSFAYDALGRRAQKTIDSLLTQFHYDGLDITREIGGAGDASYLRTLAIDETLVRADAADTVHYVGDALGSTVALTDSTGVSATTYAYEPFGQTETAGTPNPNAFRFTGREDDGTGLYYYRARYYSPGRGRFLSADPIGVNGGLNFYRYAGDNPLRFVDRLGLAPIDSACEDCPGGEWKMDIRSGFSVALIFGYSRTIVDFTCVSSGKKCRAFVNCGSVGAQAQASLSPGSREFESIGTGTRVKSFPSSRKLRTGFSSSGLAVSVSFPGTGFGFSTSGNNLAAEIGLGGGIAYQGCSIGEDFFCDQ